MRFLICMAVLGVASARDDDWQPIVPEASLNYATYLKSVSRPQETSPQLKIVNRPSVLSSPSYTTTSSSKLYHVVPPSDPESCSIYKVSMNQELFYQYIEYEKDLPDLKEFTLCMWTKFHNHSQDHPLFSYAIPDSPKEISAWVSNTLEASYFSMAVHGQTFFRLNYPLKLNKWYHSCQSWNGKTGEWQIWVNAERVGRGFHNRLVGHIIKGGGVAVSGQEQSLLYKKDGLEPVIKESGVMGEMTMVQLYHVALTAGKAHKDHKHHHAHHFRHDGTPIEPMTEAPTEPPPPMPIPIGNGNFLIGNQLMRAPNLNFAGAQPQQEQPQMIAVQLPNGIQLRQPYVNGQLGSRIVSEQLINSVQQSSQNSVQGGAIPVPVLGFPLSHQQSAYSVPQQPAYTVPQPPAFSVPQQAAYTVPQRLGPSKKTTVVLSSSLLNPANVQFIDDAALSHNVFRRDSTKRDKRDNPEKELEEERQTGSKKDKRGLVTLSDGSVVDEALLSPNLTEEDVDEDMFQQSLLKGLAGFVGNQPIQNEQKQTVDEREPAEAEVKAVMQVCSGCAPEPFKKALVISWRTTAKKLYSGAHYYKGLPICKAF